MKRPGLHFALFLVLAIAAGAWASHAAQAQAREGNAFMSIALHDVVDTPAQLDEDSVTSDRLVVLLEWLAGNGWTAVGLDDVERARRGIQPLPRKAVLITVDDGLSSLYTRVYPLAVAYRMPIVAAVVGEWMDVPANGTVRYGDRTLPRSAFISWEQARQMQASGWVEFASHSHALHGVVRANPQGNLLPAGQNRIFLGGRYENDDEFRARIRADLARSRERLRQELGREPRAMVWPYGRYNEDTLALAKESGFTFALTLESGPADAARPLSIPRFLPANDPALSTWVDNLRLHDPWPPARRIVAFDTAQLVGGDAAQTDARLGRAIERLVALGATHVMLDAGTVSPEGRLESTWFPNTRVPIRGDVLGRFAAQMRARAAVDVIVRMPHAAALRRLGDRQETLALYRDLAVHAPFEGLLIEDAPSLGTAVANGADTPWQVARIRESERFAGWPADDATALEAFFVAQRLRPGLQAYWLAPAGHSFDRPSALADVTLIARMLHSRRDDPRIPPTLGRRVGIFLRMPDAGASGELAREARAFQFDGGTVIAWGPDDALTAPEDARAIAPVVSARRFPRPDGGAP